MISASESLPAIGDHLLDIAALRADARHQERHVADDRAHFAQLLRPGRADHQRAVAVAVPVARDVLGDVLVQRLPPQSQVLQVPAPGFEVRHSITTPLSARSRNGCTESRPRYGLSVTASAP